MSRNGSFRPRIRRVVRRIHNGSLRARILQAQQNRSLRAPIRIRESALRAIQETFDAYIVGMLEEAINQGEGEGTDGNTGSTL
ncbi:expressed unknown protein [Seminavis robusta]|uniref:Uncharacterized protein n=1 Tax=Seminavis robusta TaxID=568900 RepID=A0A9N8EV27_9STRA|nr:expressed unknown protein [Seminavis robusta]|eukprot:Sro2045_g312460.1 n/a (83) ;mRNA; f:13286-13651